jgi:LysW-gamma-L-lysine carboxypeptidase
MLEIYSPSGSETALAQFLRGEMQARGMNSRIDGAGNVLGVVGTEGPAVLLCGHMDTVPGMIPVRREGDLLYGRGAVDAKASLAAMILGTMLAKERSTLPIRITVAAVVEEETSSRGIREIMRDGSRYDLAVFGEPSGVSNMIMGYKGSLRLHLTFHTPGGHSAAPWLSASSYEESSAFWHRFQRRFLRNDHKSKFDSVTGCVTNIISDGPGNSVPARTTLDIDVRIPPTVKPVDLADEVREFVDKYGGDQDRVKTELRIDDQTPAFVGLADSYQLSAFRWAIRSVRGGQVALVRKTGTGDVNLYAEHRNIPMFAYGPGDSKLDHTENEHISLAEYLASIEVYARALPRIAERAKHSELIPAAIK